VRIALQGHLSFSASVKAIYDTLKSLRDGVAPGDLTDTLATPDMMGKVTRSADYANWTKEFMN